jgi:AsmA protein
MTSSNEPREPRIDLYADRDVGRTAPARPARKRGYGGLILLGALVVVGGVGGWLAVSEAVSPERLKAEIERSVTHATGRVFTINGPIHVTLSLAPEVTAENVSLANIDGGTRAQMLTASSLSGRVALLPLMFGGEVVVEDVTLTNPDLLLEQNADGMPNWQFRVLRRPLTAPPAASGDTGEPPAARAEGGTRASRVQIHAVHFEGGHIAWRPAPGSAFGTLLAADVKSLAVFAPDDDTPMHGTLTGRAGTTDITAKLNTGAFNRLEGGPVTVLAGAWPLTLEVQGAGASLKLEGGINHPDQMRGYAFLLSANAPDLAPFAGLLPRPLALPLHDVNLTVRLTDGNNEQFRTEGLSLHAGSADLSSAIPGLVLKDAVFSAPGPGQQAQLSVQGVFQGAPLRLVGTATQPDVLATNVPVPLAFSGQVASATLSARGTLPASVGANGLDLQVSVRTPTLADLSPLAGRPLPDIRDVVFEAHLGDAGFRLRGVDMRNVVFSSSLGDVAGNVTLAWAPVATLNGTLTSKHFDIDAAQDAWAAYQAAAPAPAGAATGTPAAAGPAPGQPVVAAAAPDADSGGGRMFSDRPLPFAALHGADADLTLSAGSLTIAHETYRDLSARLLANDGKLILNPLRIVAPQGLLTGALSLDAGIDPPPVAVTLRSPSMSAAGLAAALGYAGGATGTVQVDAQLSGTGTTPHELAASVSGHLGLTMVNGTITDTLLEGALGSALNAAGVPPIGGSTEVRCFALRTDFHHGMGEVQDLSLDTSRLALDGDGSVNLGDETLNLHLRPVLRVGGTGVAAPVLLQGGFSNLKPTLEPAMAGGRFGLTIGGPAPNDNACAGKLSEARGGMAGPMPNMVAAPQQSGGKHKKPADLLRGLFH